MDPTTIPGSATTSTSIGPNGTAPGLAFIEQQVRPRTDSSVDRAAGLPLLLGGVALLVVFAVVFLRAALARRRSTTSDGG